VDGPDIEGLFKCPSRLGERVSYRLVGHAWRFWRSFLRPAQAFVERHQFVGAKPLMPLSCGWPRLCGGIASYRNSELHA
jgi:hypothetical protein